jgi:hypothetical protein
LKRTLIIALTLLFLVLLGGAAQAGIWPDFLPGHDSTEAFLYENGLMLGYPDGDFHPYQTVTQRQVVTVLVRGGIRADLDPADYPAYPATMEWVQNILPGTVLSAAPTENCTRFRFGVMLERWGLVPGPLTEVVPANDIAIMGAKLDAWFLEKQVTWQGVTRTPAFYGYGELIAQLSRDTGVPIWLCLGMSWYESQWGTTGLSVRINCAFGVKDGKGKWGQIRGTVKGFADYVSTEEMIRAWFRLMSSPAYSSYIESGNWDGLCEKYGPSFENNHTEHLATTLSFRGKCEQRGIR